MNVARALFLVAMLFGTIAVSRGEDAAPKADALAVANEFTDKIAIVYLDEAMRIPSMVLSGVELKEIGGRTFLIGVGAESQRQSDWRSGKKVRISWASVTGYLLFTVEEYAGYLKESHPEA